MSVGPHPCFHFVYNLTLAQEREFQNLFTFSPGFEAAALKIPNKEYTAYNAPLPSSSNPSSQLQRYYPTDPYSLGSVVLDGQRYYRADPYSPGDEVLDGGRDGMASLSTAQPESITVNHYHIFGDLPLTAPNPALATSSNTLNPPQRKQIIGFAKFRTREDALSARDVLQGRRVDFEKGAVLKAEMAKKNLLTRRGVGLVPGTLPPSAGGPSNPSMQIQRQQQQQQQQHDTTLFGPPSDFAHSSLPSSSQQNSIPALSRLGWRDSVSRPLSVGSSSFAQQQIANSSTSNSTTSLAAEDDRKRDSTSLLTLGGLDIVSNEFAASIPQKSMLGGFMVQGATDEAAEWSKKGKMQDFLTGILVTKIQLDDVFRESIRFLIDKSMSLPVDESALQELSEQGKIYNLLSSVLLISVVAEIGESLKAAISQIITLLRDKNTSGGAYNDKRGGRIPNFLIWTLLIYGSSWGAGG